jgi:hypothetical protein
MAIEKNTITGTQIISDESGEKWNIKIDNSGSFVKTDNTKSVKELSQLTTIDPVTQQATVQPIAIIENIVNNSITNVVNNTTIIQSAVEENPAIAGALEKLATIQEGAQVNEVTTEQLSSVEQAATAAINDVNTHKVNEANPHKTTKEQVGVNFQTGTITMSASKKAIVSFGDAFNKIPRVSVTLLDNSQAPAYTTAVSKTGFTINMPIPFSGQIEWIALERE